MSVRTLGQTVGQGTVTAFRTVVIGLAVYGGLDLMRSAMAQDAATAYLPVVASAEEVKSLEDRVAALEDLLVHVSRDGNDIYVTGANLHVVNGEGKTDSMNGLGNIVVGYNEDVSEGLDQTPHDRTGSHMFVDGVGNSYSGFGGMVIGLWNTTSGPYASVVGGANNVASGDNASICGGHTNTADGDKSSVSGGTGNAASGFVSSVSGGYYNTAVGRWSTVSGGAGNTTSEPGATVSGGEGNTAGGWSASVCGGRYGRATGFGSSVTGGVLNVASGDSSSVAGGTRNEASGVGSTVTGGIQNVASARAASVSGGEARQANAAYNWRAGDLFQEN